MKFNNQLDKNHFQNKYTKIQEQGFTFLEFIIIVSLLGLTSRLAIPFFKASLENKPTVECWGTGKPLREFLHVDDLAAGCIHSLEYWNPIGEFALKNKNDKLLNYLNIGSGIEISIKELAYLISDCIGYKGKIIWDESKPDGTFKKNLDSSRIQSLGWEPKIGLKEGIKKTIEDFKSKYLKGEESIKNFVN